jgi:hypothetical protein
MGRKWVPRARPEGTQEERECGGKLGYPSESTAEAALTYFRRERVARTNDGMESYQCRFCLQWHFGH